MIEIERAFEIFDLKKGGEMFWIVGNSNLKKLKFRPREVQVIPSSDPPVAPGREVLGGPFTFRESAEGAMLLVNQPRPWRADVVGKDGEPICSFYIAAWNQERAVKIAEILLEEEQKQIGTHLRFQDPYWPVVQLIFLPEMKESERRRWFEEGFFIRYYKT